MVDGPVMPLSAGASWAGRLARRCSQDESHRGAVRMAVRLVVGKLVFVVLFTGTV